MEAPQRRLTKALPIAVVVSLALIAPAASGADGRSSGLDPSFGENGRVVATLPASYSTNTFGAPAVRPDGRIVVEMEGNSGTWLYGPSSAAIELREPNGSLDPAFGEGGKVGTNATSAPVVDAANRILFGDEEVVKRLSAGGSPDQSFDRDGASATVPFVVRAVTVEADGDIVVAGNPEGVHSKYLVPSVGVDVARFLPNGELDQGFGEGGIATVVPIGGASAGTEILGLVDQPDGSTLLLTFAGIARVGPEGKLDGSFGGNGLLTVAGHPRGLASLPGGEFAVAFKPEGTHCCEPGVEVARFSAAGVPIPSFLVRARRLAGGPARIVSTGDGGVIVGGLIHESERAGSPGPTRVALYRFDASGAPVASFGRGGMTYAGAPNRPWLLPTSEPKLAGLAMTAGGDVLATGGNGGDATLVARSPRGGAPAGFGSEGGAIQEASRMPETTAAGGILLGADGRLLLAVETTAATAGIAAGIIPFSPTGRDLPTPGGPGFFRSPAVRQVKLAAGDLFALHTNPCCDSLIYRFGEDGSPDRRFATDGAFRIPDDFEPSTYAVTADGRVTIFGERQGRKGAVALRLTAAGPPDPRFGRRGLKQLGLPGLPAPQSALALPGGGILMASYRPGQAVFARLSAAGQVDRHFGRDGEAPGPPEEARGRIGIVRQGGGFVFLVPKFVQRIGEERDLLFRLDSNGRLDSQFGNRARLTIGAGEPVALLADRDRLVAVVEATGGHGVLARAFLPDGGPDRSFGRQGESLALTPKKTDFRPSAAVMQANGRVVIAGSVGEYENARGGAVVIALR